MNRSRRSSREIRRSTIPRRPVFVRNQLVSGRGRQVTARAIFFPPKFRLARPRTVIPLVSSRSSALSWRAPGRLVSRPRPVRLITRKQSVRVIQRSTFGRPFFMPASDPCARRRATRAMMFVQDVAGRAWSSSGGPSPPSRRSLQSEVSCKR